MQAVADPRSLTGFISVEASYILEDSAAKLLVHADPLANLPREDSGKIRKHKLCDQYWPGRNPTQQ